MIRLAGLSARLLPAVFAAGLGSLVLAAAGAPVHLVSVSSSAGDDTQTVFIEASEPAAYAVSRPDPQTILVELRHVQVSGAVRRLEEAGLVKAVSFEDGVALDGNPVGRVRLVLARPASHKVRSERNMIRLDLVALKQPPKQAPASSKTRRAARVAAAETNSPSGATVLQTVHAAVEGGRVTIRLAGNGPLVPASMVEAEDMPPRVVLDFPGVRFTAPPQTAVGGAVRRVRVALNQHTPPVTRVVIDLEKRLQFRAERAGADLVVVLEESDAAHSALEKSPIAEEGSDQAETGHAAAASDRGAHATFPADVQTVQTADGEVYPVVSDFAAAAGTGAIDPMAALRLASTAEPIASQAAAAEQAPPPAPSQPAPAPAAPVPAAQPPQQPAPEPPPAQGGTFADATEAKQYTGHAVSLDFQNADLRSVLRTFAEISGLNMVIDPNVQGSVDIVLTDVPWDQALDIILRANNLGYSVDGTIVRVATLQTLQAEQEQRRRLRQAQADAGQLIVRTWQLSYARAEAIQPLITRSALSSRGQIQVDPRTNTLIVTDLPERLETAANLIGILDRPEPQVEVEARIVQTTREFARAIGVQWGFGGRMTPELGNTTDLTFPNRVIVGGRQGAQQGPNDVRAQPGERVPSAFSVPVTGEGVSAVGVQLGAVNGAFNLDVALTALERSGKGRVLSTPRLTTQNNIEAEVAQGVQIPIQTTANNTVTVSFRDAVLLLKVTPQITSANTVIMRITVENASPDFSRQVNNIPPIDTQRAITQVQVHDGATTVIGGIFVSREQSSSNRVPLLHRIPLLGWLFKRDSIADESRELLIFITPRILRG
jgi:type IV pilus assembly protein PilQ